MNKYLSVIVIIFIFLPKINIYGVAGSGIRIEDFSILLFMSFFLLQLGTQTNLNFTNNQRIKLLLKIYFLSALIVCTGVISTLFNSESGLIEILFSVRLLEYSSYLFVGYYVSKVIDVTRLFYWYILINSIVIFMQKYGVVGGFATGNYVSDVSTRPIGLTSGPWEIGMILSFGIIWLIEKKKRNIVVKWGTIFFISAALVSTGSRIAIASTILVLFIRIIKANNFSLVKTVSLISLLLFSSAVIIINSDRMENILSNNNLSYIESAIENVDSNNYVMNEPNVTEFGDFKYGETDLSLAFRVLKWVHVVKKTISSADKVLLGYGPGHFGVAVDGSYIRVFGEVGVLGLLLYCFLFLSAAKVKGGGQVKLYLAVLLINAVFIDVLYASRAMSWLFILAGGLVFSGYRSVPNRTSPIPSPQI